MMKKLVFKMNKKAFTLIEIIFAVTISAAIMTSVGVLLSLALKGWELGEGNDELGMHARIATDRIIHEIRYANKILQVGPDVVTFETTNLLDPDVSTVEKIRYKRLAATDDLVRSVNLTGTNIVAGGEGIRVTQFSSIGKKRSGGGPLVNAATAQEATSVGLTIKLRDNEGYEVETSSMATIRN